MKLSRDITMGEEAASTVKNEEEPICYYHFDLTFNPSEVATRFHDVQFVLVAGCARRVAALAKYLVQNLHPSDSPSRQQAGSLQLLTSDSSRFSLFKLGPILLADHGMGPASVSIALHELFRMCQQAQTIGKITLIRFGSCGGIGVPIGTVCVTNRSFDPLFNEFVELKICLKLVRRSTRVDPCVAEELVQLAEATRKLSKQDEQDLGGKFEVRLGATMGTNDFYEETGRTNGAICEHSQQDERLFLEKAREMGVINMEMESTTLAAMCNKLAVPFGVVCVTVNDRLLFKWVPLSQMQTATFERRLFWLVTQFIRKRLDLEFEAQHIHT